VNRNAWVAAVIAATIGVALLFMYKKRFEAETSGGPRIPVLIASRDIPFGDVLTRDAIAIRDVPLAYIEERHIRASDGKRVLGVRVSRSIRANESVLWSDLAVSSEAGRTLAGMIQPGMRALAVPASITSTFGGLLRPGDRVDAFLTTLDRDPSARVTVPLLQNLLVLAVGADVGMVHEIREDDDNDNKPPQFRLSTVTTAVTPHQAEVLTYAQQHGLLTLVLRNPDDVAIVEGLPEATLEDILSPGRRDELQQRRPRIRESTTGSDALERLQ
jgi:pilus assembly protein CpaB